MRAHRRAPRARRAALLARAEPERARPRRSSTRRAAIRAERAGDPRRQRARPRRGRSGELSPAMLDRLHARRQARRGDGQGPRRRRRAARSGRHGARRDWTRPNGLDIARVRVPLGVIGIIYESRPNVTADAGGLCLRAGNAAILRGGSESFHSSRAIVGVPAAAASQRPACPRTRCSSCRRATAPPSA